jgi:hypothetical protein
MQEKVPQDFVKSITSHVRLYIQSELGTYIGGSPLRVQTLYEANKKLLLVTLRLGGFHSGVMIPLDLLFGTVAPEVFVLATIDRLIQALRAEVYDRSGYDTIEEFAMVIFEDVGVLIGGDW